MQKIKQLLFPAEGHYRKGLITILLLASLPGMIIGLFMFFVSKTHIQDELKKVHQNHLYDSMKTIDDQFSYIEQFLAHWAYDPSFNERFKDIDFVYKYREVHEIYQSLMIMEGSTHLVDRIELFLTEPNAIVFTKERYNHLTNEEHINSYRALLNSKRSLFWNNTFSSVEKSYDNRYSPLSLIHKIPGGIEEPFGAIIASFNKEKMANLLKSPYENGTMFLITDKDLWLFGNENQSEPSNMDQAIFREVQNSKKEPATFLFEWDKITYSVTYETFSRLGKSWFFISAAPLSTITAPVIFISKLMIIVSIVILILAIILSILASKRLYSPIDKLIKKVNEYTVDIQPTKVKNEFE